jgi:hypothetical protein
MVESTIKQLPEDAPTPPTTWSESQVHRQVNFQTVSSPTLWKQIFLQAFRKETQSGRIAAETPIFSYLSFFSECL